ncbi:hypothetical protein ACFXPY_45110 [Streptomyces sp. NPDC059153]|uniref:hypothetical protein n=1 Tax=Streptomyces sp. NPDC059153 TaxID=3346743 RepID=UPI0036941DDA
MYRYRCNQCRTTSPAVRSKREVETERDRHRARAHAGHIPDGEEIQTHTPPHRPGQPTRPLHYVLYVWAGLVLLFLIWLRF